MIEMEKKIDERLQAQDRIEWAELREENKE